MKTPSQNSRLPMVPSTLGLGTRVIGIDPGLQTTGYAVIEVSAHGPHVCEAGVIRSSENPGRPELALRLLSLYTGVDEVVVQFQPHVMVVEQLYAHYQHPRTAILMAHARGIIFLSAAQHRLPVVSYNATRIKKAITGNGRAPKDQVQRTMQRELGLAKLPEPADVADALAVALCHYYVQRWPVEKGL